MYATEFQTIIQNSYIQIPNYEKFKNREVRVIILDTARPHVERVQKDEVTEFRELSRHISVVDKDVDILSLDKDINSDIF